MTTGDGHRGNHLGAQLIRQLGQLFRLQATQIRWNINFIEQRGNRTFGHKDISLDRAVYFNPPVLSNREQSLIAIDQTGVAALHSAH